jgi:hypothetical protein
VNPGRENTTAGKNSALLEHGAVEPNRKRNWRTPVSATDGRSVDVIVHHVASVYPKDLQEVVKEA